MEGIKPPNEAVGYRPQQPTVIPYTPTWTTSSVIAIVLSSLAFFGSILAIYLSFKAYENSVKTIPCNTMTLNNHQRHLKDTPPLPPQTPPNDTPQHHPTTA